MTGGAFSDFGSAEYPVSVHGVAAAHVAPNPASESVRNEVVSLDLFASAVATQMDSAAFSGRQRQVKQSPNKALLLNSQGGFAFCFHSESSFRPACGRAWALGVSAALCASVAVRSFKSPSACSCVRKMSCTDSSPSCMNETITSRWWRLQPFTPR